MSWLQYFSLRRLNGRIFWAFVGLAALMAGTGITIYFLLSAALNTNQEQDLRLKQAADMRLYQATVDRQLTALDLINLYNLPRGLEYLETIRASSAALLSQISLDFPAGDEASGGYRSLQTTYERIGSRITAARSMALTAAQEREVYSAIRADLDRIQSDSQAFLMDRQRVAAAATRSYLNLVDNARLGYIISAVVLFGLAVIFAFLIARLVARPLALLATNLARIAIGDLTEQMPTRGPQEVGELSLTFNRTIANLKLALARIQQQAGSIDRTSEVISRSSDNQATGLAEQAVALSQVSATIAQLSDTSQQIADSAALVAKSANDVLENATDGYDTMLGASETMNEIRLKVNLIADRILNLNSVAQRIREVTLLIDTLSNETHLLALNAAIESAGAGEEGARFAVVAGHVRKLSLRSRTAAVEIQQLVNQIQHAAASSVMATEEGIKVVALGEKMVNDTLQAHQNIIGQFDQTTQLAQAISQATEQQRIASNQVADTMRQLSEISKNISRNSQQYLYSATDLREVVDQLNQVVNAFVIQEPAPDAGDQEPYPRTTQAQTAPADNPPNYSPPEFAVNSKA